MVGAFITFMLALFLVCASPTAVLGDPAFVLSASNAVFEWRKKLGKPPLTDLNKVVYWVRHEQFTFSSFGCFHPPRVEGPCS